MKPKNVHLDGALLARCTKLLAKLKERPEYWNVHSVQDAARVAMAKGLAELERELDG